jgi:hypothetical protein
MKKVKTVLRVFKGLLFILANIVLYTIMFAQLLVRVFIKVLQHSVKIFGEGTIRTVDFIETVTARLFLSLRGKNDKKKRRV